MSKTQTKLKGNPKKHNLSEVTLEGDPQIVARDLVALIPLDDVCQDKILMDAFLSEMFLALARASSREERRKKQAEGIAAAKARGVHFGKKPPSLPDNFDTVRRAWRNGDYNLIEAARLCRMPKSTFFNAVQRAENAEAQKVVPTERAESHDAKEIKKTASLGRSEHTVRYDQNASLSDAGANRAF